MQQRSERSSGRAAALFLLLACACGPDAPPPGDARAVLVIAHRGASGYLPEHTLAAYAMAHALGADYLEPDLVMTRDGVPIARHDLHLETTTDAAERFPGRARADGHFYAADFLLAETRELEAREARTGRFAGNATGFRVPSFDEVLTLVAELDRLTGCRVGICSPGSSRSAAGCRCLPTRPSSGATPSGTLRASTRTGSSRGARPTRSSTRRASATPPRIRAAP